MSGVVRLASAKNPKSSFAAKKDANESSDDLPEAVHIDALGARHERMRVRLEHVGVGDVPGAAGQDEFESRAGSRWPSRPAAGSSHASTTGGWSCPGRDRRSPDRRPASWSRSGSRRRARCRRHPTPGTRRVRTTSVVPSVRSTVDVEPVIVCGSSKATAGSSHTSALALSPKAVLVTSPTLAIPAIDGSLAECFDGVIRVLRRLGGTHRAGSSAISTAALARAANARFTGWSLPGQPTPEFATRARSGGMRRRGLTRTRARPMDVTSERGVGVPTRCADCDPGVILRDTCRDWVGVSPSRS